MIDEPASPAPGMPSEEMRERVAMICMEIEEDRSPDNVSEMFRVYGASDHDEGKRCPYGCGRCDVERARSNADRIFALIRPAFEAKEREIEQLEWQIRAEQEACIHWCGEAAKFNEQRLSAEAKLAQVVEDEREACAAIMDLEATFAAENLAAISDEENSHWGNDIKVRAYWSSRQTLAERAANAIRARAAAAMGEKT